MLEAVPADERPVEVLDELVSFLEASGELRRAMTWAMEAMRLAPEVTRYRQVLKNWSDAEPIYRARVERARIRVAQLGGN